MQEQSNILIPVYILLVDNARMHKDPCSVQVIHSFFKFANNTFFIVHFKAKNLAIKLCYGVKICIQTCIIFSMCVVLRMLCTGSRIVLICN